MVDIKLIKEDTDLSGVKKPYGWDLEVNRIPYDIYRIEGYVHTIGGSYGENCLWACPADEKPSYENLIQFHGDAPTWGVTFDRKNFIKDKYDQTSVEVNGRCWITRNGKRFYEIAGRDMNYCLSKAQYVLVRLIEDCPLNLHERDWKEKAIGEKIWYREEPAIIQHITNNNLLFIIPDGINKFKLPVDWNEEEWEDYEDGLVVELLSPNISWFRK